MVCVVFTFFFLQLNPIGDIDMSESKNVAHEGEEIKNKRKIVMKLVGIIQVQSPDDDFLALFVRFTYKIQDEIKTRSREKKKSSQCL